MGDVPCGGIFVIICGFLVFPFMPPSPYCKVLMCFYHRYQFLPWWGSSQFKLKILPWPLFLYYLFNLLQQGWCLEPVQYPIWLYFIFLFFVLHSIPHKSNSHSNCFVHLNGHVCVCRFKWTESCVCSHLLINWCIVLGYKVLLNLNVHYCIWCLNIFLCPTHFHILVIDMYDLD